MYRNLIFIALLCSGCIAINAPGPGRVDTSGRADPAPLIYAPSGTRIVLENLVDRQKNQSEITITDAIGLRGGFTRANGSPGGVYPGCWGCGGTTQIEEGLYSQLWPLETGKQVAFLRTAPDGTKARAVIRVAGTERLETPFGMVETYRLIGRIQNLTGPRYSAQVTAWWAPDPGWVIRAEGGDSRGRTLLSQVVEVKRP